MTLLLTSSGQKWQFHIATNNWWSRMAVLHCYSHLVVKNGNFILLLTSSGYERKNDITTDIRNGNFRLLLTSRGQQWQFHIATDI